MEQMPGMHANNRNRTTKGRIARLFSARYFHRMKRAQPTIATIAATNATPMARRARPFKVIPASPTSRSITKVAVAHPTGTLFKATIQFPVMRRVRGIAQRTAGITSHPRILKTFSTMLSLRFHS